MISSAQSILEDMPIAVLEACPDSLEIQWANVAAQGYLGQSLNALRGKLLADLFDDGESLFDVSAKVRESLSSIKIHGLTVTHRLGGTEDCDVQMFPSQNAIGVCLMTSEKPRSVGDSGGEAMAAMGRMLAHEIKNPLAGINGAAQLLGLDIDSEDGKDLIRLIQSEIGRIGRLTDRMERLGDVDTGELTPVNIHAVLQQARAVLVNSLKSDIKITEHYDPSVPAASGHVDGLIQAVINLIKNGIESIENSGHGNEIRLETSFRRGIRQKLDDDDGYRDLPIVIKVSDNGPGISPDVRDKLFQPFVSSKPMGQGLGLSLVSKVVSAHHGQISVHHENGWTSFSIYLPLSQANPSPESKR